MFGIKTKIIDEKNKILKKKSFPIEGLNFLKKRLVLLELKSILNKENLYFDKQAPVTQFTNEESRVIWKKLIKYNPNNLGNWSLNTPHNLSGKLEKQLIEQFIDLYKESKNKIGGHLTNGGTEGNLYASWIGKEYLKKHTKLEKIVLLKSDLTHYSVEKACLICEIKENTVAISEKSWGIDPTSLEKEIRSLIKKGFNGFLVPLTIGYTLTGTSDPIDEICRLVKKIKKENKKINFFIWIDATFSGFTKTFVGKNFRPFKNKDIELYLVDLHKFAGVPYPAGLVFYKKSILKNIERKVSYIGQKDSTISGSRSGLSAIASWYAIQSIGKNGWKKIVKNSLKEKNDFIKKIESQNKEIKVINEKDSPQLCLIAKNKKEEKLLKDMGLNFTQEKIKFVDSNKVIKIYKIFFLPNFN